MHTAYQRGLVPRFDSDDLTVVRPDLEDRPTPPKPLLDSSGPTHVLARPAPKPPADTIRVRAVSRSAAANLTRGQLYRFFTHPSSLLTLPLLILGIALGALLTRFGGERERAPARWDAALAARKLSTLPSAAMQPPKEPELPALSQPKPHGQTWTFRPAAERPRSMPEAVREAPAKAPSSELEAARAAKREADRILSNPL